MAMVKVRAGAVLTQVVRIDQNRIAAIRGIVQRVAIRIRDAGGERSAGVPYRGLKCVIA